MKKNKEIFVFLSLVSLTLVQTNLNCASEEEETGPTGFEACLEELKKLASSSPEDESADDYEPEVSLEESIRIYDECLKKEGITLSIHEALGGGAEAGVGTGNGSSNTNTGSGEGTTQSESGSQSGDLETSIQQFDTMLSQVQSEIEADRAEQIAQAAKEQSESTQSTQPTNAESNELNEDMVTEQSEGSISSSATVSAEAKHQSTTRSPLDPKDEDIVLKTIREAAELETNPTTKQALWDQYYDYADKKK